MLLNHVRVEPELGSPARGGLPATVARRTAGGWSLSGRKRFATGVEGLDWLLVWATTDEPTPRVGTFLVPGDAPGIEITHRWDHLGLRASGSHDIALHDVEIPYGQRHRARPARAPRAEQDNRAGAALHLPLAALYLGVARAAQGYVHRFAHERVPANLGHPVARTERFRRGRRGDRAAARLGRTSGVRRCERGRRGRRLVHARTGPGRPCAGGPARHRAVELAVRLLGNPGLARDNPLERHFRDIQCAPVHAPQADTRCSPSGRGRWARDGGPGDAPYVRRRLQPSAALLARPI